MTRLDANGQPHLGLNAALRHRRDIDELLGVCKGILFDGVVEETEATALDQWILNHPDVRDVWPVRVIADRLARIFEDGIVDAEERAELRALLEQVVGADDQSASGTNRASQLPLTQPPPAIVFPDRTFCFTGKFYYGTRRSCTAAVEQRGGLAKNNVSRATDYLVIGLLGSRDWIHSSWGTKIEKAIDYRDRHDVAIVGEDHWAAAL